MEKLQHKYQGLQMKAILAQHQLEVHKEAVLIWEKKSFEASERVQSLATDLWGGAGPDCRTMQG